MKYQLICITCNLFSINTYHSFSMSEKSIDHKIFPKMLGTARQVQWKRAIEHIKLFPALYDGKMFLSIDWLHIEQLLHNLILLKISFVFFSLFQAIFKIMLPYFQFYSSGSWRHNTQMSWCFIDESIDSFLDWSVNNLPIEWWINRSFKQIYTKIIKNF